MYDEGTADKRNCEQGNGVLEHMTIEKHWDQIGGLGLDIGLMAEGLEAPAALDANVFHV